MEAESIPKQLKEQTEKHHCVRCLKETPCDVYLENDFLCDECAAIVDKTMNDER